jgi:hypothetical protein
MEYLRKKKCAPWQTPGRNVWVFDSVRANEGFRPALFNW